MPADEDNSDRGVMPDLNDMHGLYGAKLWALARRLGCTPQEADDAVQEVYVKVLRYADRYVAGNFEAWLRQILRNTVIDTYRRRRIITMTSMGNDTIPDRGTPSAEDEVLLSELSAPLAGALARTPELFREAVLLCDVDGLSYAEVARRTGAPVGTVRSRISRGRAAMRAELAREGIFGATA